MPILRTNNSIWHLLILAFLVSGLGLSGCVSAPKYPDNWSSLTKPENKCTVLTGTYSDTGESAQNQESGEAVSLFRTLFPDSGIEPTNVIDKITFMGPEKGVLEITAWSCNVPIATKYLKESIEYGLMCYLGRYLCHNNGSVEANSCAGGGAAPIGVGGAGQGNLLYRAENGSLVLKSEEIIIVVPLWFQFKHRWYRFRPVSQDEDME